MKRRFLTITIFLGICLFAVGCGSNATDKEQNIDTQITEQQEEIDTQEVELSGLSSKVCKFFFTPLSAV